MRCARDEHRGEGDIEMQPLRLEFFAGGTRLGDAFLGQTDIAPAGEQIFQIPIALAVAHEHEKPVTHSFFPFDRHCRATLQKSFSPNTSAIE